MITFYQTKTRSWSTAGNGPLRPIVVDTETRAEGVKQYGILYQDQLCEEYARQETISHHTDQVNYWL